MRLAAICQRKAPLRFRFGSDEIRECLRAGKIHLPVKEGPFGELASVSHAQPGKTSELIQDSRYDRASAMEVKLRAILACKTGWARKEKAEAAIQNRAILTLNSGQDCMPRLGHTTRHLLQDFARSGTRDADDGHSRRQGATRKRKDCIANLHLIRHGRRSTFQLTAVI